MSDTPQNDQAQKATIRPLTPEEKAMVVGSLTRLAKEKAEARQEQKDLIKEAITEALEAQKPLLCGMKLLRSYRLTTHPKPAPKLGFFARLKQLLFGKS